MQTVVFAIQPWEREACTRLPTDAEKEEYRSWVDEVALAIGDAHVALVLQPDAPFALCAPHGSDVPLELMRYATSGSRPSRTPASTSRLGRRTGCGTTWPRRCASWCRPASRVARGFALNSTHYDSTARQIRFAADISRALEARGIPGKFAVVNTAQNGRPFKGYEYDGANYDNARACSDREEPDA